MKMIRETKTLLHRDILLGFHYVRNRFLVAVLFMIVLVGLTIYEFDQLAIHNQMELASYTYSDVIFTLFKGVDFEILHNPTKEFPFTWFMVLAFGPFMIGGYVRDDLFNQSSVLFIRARYQLSIWLSKILFCLLITILFYAIFLLLIVAATALFLSYSSEWGAAGIVQIEPLITIEITPLSFSLQAILFPLLTSIILVIIQGIVSVFIRPIYTLFIILSLLIISVFSASFFFPGSYSMILRHELFAGAQGFDWLGTIIYTVIIIGVVTVAGFVLFKRQDIIQKGEE